MKVIVIGAGSQVGQFVIKYLQEAGHESVAIVNEKNKAPDMKKLGAQKAEANGRRDFTSAFSACDAVIFLSESSPNVGEGKTILVDHRAVIDAVQAAKSSGIRRFVMMSAVRAGESLEDRSEMTGAKDMPDELIQEEAMNYTVIRPARMTDKPGKGTVTMKDSPMNNNDTIPREDVAAVLVAILEKEAVFNRILDVSSGPMPIDDAIQALN